MSYTSILLASHLFLLGQQSPLSLDLATPFSTRSLAAEPQWSKPG
jgi:hypothetical protein